MHLPNVNGRLVRLRTIAPSDRDRIIEIRQLDAVARWWRGDDLGREFDDDMAADDLHQFAIELPNGTVVGMIQFGEEDDPDYRHASIDLFVDPAFHRQGIASDAISRW
jgi:aminoglycoside 6'-N-acetyltransferase